MDALVSLVTTGIAVTILPLVAATLLRTGRILERVEMLRVEQEKMNGRVADHETRLSFLEGRADGDVS